MALMLGERLCMKTPGSSNYDTIYWFDKLERKLMTYEDICKRYRVDSMSDEELKARNYAKVDRMDVMAFYRYYAAQHMTDELAAKLEGKDGQEYIKAFKWYFDDTDEEWDFQLFMTAVGTYLTLKWVYKNHIAHCTLFPELRVKVTFEEDDIYGTKTRQELRAIWRKEEEEEEEYKKTLPRRTDY